MKKMILLLWATMYTFFPIFIVHSEEIGKPFMTVFPSKETGGHVQNWSIIQDRRGVMYFGDGFGVEEYDGSTWRLIVSPNKSFARSLSMDTNGRIYVGSSGMLGYLAPGGHDSLGYVSLLEYIKPEDRIFNYVWSVQTTPEGIYFQTRERLFFFRPVGANSDSKKSSESWNVKVWKPRENFGYTFWIDQTFYVQQQGIGLTKMVGDSLVPIPSGGQFASDRIQVMLPFPGKPGSYLIGTFNRGLFVWDGNEFRSFQTDSDPLLREGTVYTGVLLPDSCFALGTMSKGMFIIDSQGKTKLHLTLDSGLTSNTVSTMFVDAQKNLWAGMDGGIAVLEYNSPLSQFSLPAGSSPTDFIRHRGILYTSANTGVAYLDPVDSRFKFISGMTGNNQAFYFGQIGNDLFINSGSGIYRIDGTIALPVLKAITLDFVFLCLATSRQDHNIVFGGLTSGLALFRYDAGDLRRLRFLGHVPGVYEYIRYIIEPEPGTFWLSPSDVGPIRLTFKDHNFNNPIIERFGPENGLPNGGITVYSTVRGLAFCTKSGVYKFDPEKKRFTPDPFFKDVNLGRNPDEGIVVSDQDGNIWANLGSETVLFKRQPDGNYQRQKELLSRFADDPALSIYPEQDGYTWFGTTNYAIRLAPDKSVPVRTSYQALIRCVSFANDSVIYYGAETVQNRLNDPAGRSIPFRFNALRFDYSAPLYSNPQANEFRSKLEGFDKGWSAWKRVTMREYTNLPAGKYRFHVQAKNIYNQESREAVFAFTILTPWYASWWAYLGYVFFAIVAVYGLVRYRTRKLQARSKALEKIVEQRTAQIQEQKNNVEQLSNIGRDITSSLSIENIIHTVYENVNTLMDASVFTIGLHKPEENALEFPAAIEKNQSLLPFSIPLTDENRLGAWCFNHRHEVVINDYGTEYSKYVSQLTAPIEGESPESILYLPLWNKDKVIGVISAQSFSKNAYTDYHLNMLRNLATYCAIALENADAYRRLSVLLDELKATQDKLVTQSKMAALGTLTTGIAHEIKNPLNFVNNFAGLNSELIEELLEKVKGGKENFEPETIEEIKTILNTLKLNEGKIREHGRRADNIVRSMLLHSRGSSGELQPTDINALIEEAINLTYHGMRAQDTGFNIKIEKSLDESLGKMTVIPQELSRAFLNIISNACYEIHRKKQGKDGSFIPTLSVCTQKTGNQVKISIRDNGNGIPEKIRDKMFTPFFTTKPAGQGTGLGLSITYDIIVNQHKGQITFETEEGNYTEFIILLPYNNLDKT